MRIPHARQRSGIRNLSICANGQLPHRHGQRRWRMLVQMGSHQVSVRWVNTTYLVSMKTLLVSVTSHVDSRCHARRRRLDLRSHGNCHHDRSQQQCSGQRATKNPDSLRARVRSKLVHHLVCEFPTRVRADACGRRFASSNTARIQSAHHRHTPHRHTHTG